MIKKRGGPSDAGRGSEPAMALRELTAQALFFELDGVLVEQARLTAEGRVPWLPGALEALASIDPELFLTFVGTARSDIAFGELRERDFQRFCERFVQDCDEAQVPIRKIYSCPYHPKGRQRFRKESVFRKPAPGIYKMAQQEFDLNLQRSWMIGHTTADVLSAQRAELGTVLVRTGKAGQDGEFEVDPHFVEDDFWHAIARVNQFEHALRV